MASSVSIVEATLQHALELAPNLRPADVAEGVALGVEPRQGLVDSFHRSQVAYAVLFDGEVAFIAGANRPTGWPGEMAIVWALSGTAVDRHRKAFLRASLELRTRLLSLYPHLVNLVDARYVGALRWLAWLGFDIGPARPFGPNLEPFCFCSIRREGPWASCST